MTAINDLDLPTAVRVRHRIAALLVEHDPVHSALTGQKQAQALITELRDGCAPPDALHAVLQDLRARGDGDRLRAFTRAVQKALEGNR